MAGIFQLRGISWYHLHTMAEGFDFNSGPEKVFVDTAHMRIVNGLLHVCFESGSSRRTMLLPLPLAKQISRAIGQQIEEIEQKTGSTIEGRLPNEPMISPLSGEAPDEGSTGRSAAH